jgi:EAL and modified HD-GYP domain-containing signal transduction protein
MQNEISMHDHVFIGRQAILNAGQEIIGYELLFRESAHATFAELNSDLEAGTQVLVNTLSHMGTQLLLGGKTPFINVSNAMLDSDFLELLPAEQVVFEIVETTQADEKTVKRVKHLRGKGYRFALDNFSPNPNSMAFLPYVELVKLECDGSEPQKVRQLLREFAGRKIKLLAGKVESKEQFLNCRELGFHYFQGYFFARPETLSAKVINPAYVHLIDVLNKLQSNAELRDIEAGLKRDVALSFKLLSYINSAGSGLSCEIQSLRHAVTVLGYKQLYRWLTLLLVTAARKANTPALIKTAITRGRMAELLGRGYFQEEERSQLFIVGVFSLLDVMLNMPLEKIFGSLHLPEPIKEALLSRAGTYGPVLRLVEACESPDPEKIEACALELAMAPETANRAQLEAIAWVEQLGV